MNNYLQSNSHIRDKFKVVLYLEIMLLKILEHDTGVATCDLATKKI